MRWSVSVMAEGDRVLTHDEILELADAVAIHQGIASGIGSMSYGAQLVVEADDQRRGGRGRDGRVHQGRRTGRSATVADHESRDDRRGRRPG